MPASWERSLYGVLVGLCSFVAVPVLADEAARPDSGWRFAIDNDLLTSGDRDRDYTGGVSVTFTGRPAVQSPVSLDRAVGWIEPLVPSEARREGAMPEPALRSLQTGLIAFTPEDLHNDLADPNDRPYANLLFVSNSRTYVVDPAGPVYDTSVTLGVLGLDAAEWMQQAVHSATGSSEVGAGWDHQISDGGEPTLRVTMARQALLASSSPANQTRADLKWRAEGSAGYLTEASVALSARWGIIDTPWWSTSPERADYMMQPAPIVGAHPGAWRKELYAWAGVKLRARAYNAFLQGQFRHSDVEYRADQLETIIGEAWVGVTWQMSRSYWLSHVMRYQSREIESGPGSRDLVWAGLVLTHNF